VRKYTGALLVLCLAAALAVGILAGWQPKPGTIKNPLILEGIDNETYEERLRTKNFTGITPRTETEMLNTIHEMANTLIVAVDGKRWGFIKITEELVNLLILEVAAARHSGERYGHEDLYHDILFRWKREDFTQGVEDHNRPWALLGGTVGRAVGLQPDIKKKMREKGLMY
jgi:hypothetical protein